MCLAESEGFRHIHVHVIPKPRDLSPELKATRIFGLLGSSERAIEAVPPNEVADFCNTMRQAWRRPV